MRYCVLAAVFTSALMGVFLIGCDLLDKDVLIDNGEKVTINDSTTIRVLSSVPDSTHLIIETTSSWHADVAKGGDWCTISKHDGTKGRDTIHINVEENATTAMRLTSIVVESGTSVMVFQVKQAAAEVWLDTPYWGRTASQRMGLHGKVKTIIATENWHPNESSTYTFDDRGNLLSVRCLDKEANRYDTTRTYSYDESNHRLSCSVVADLHGNEVRNWRYEYENSGKFVAFSAHGWLDADPFAEDMEGMIVPDLSASYKTWTDGNTKFHEDRTYTFENDKKLVIVVYKWKEKQGERTDISRDSMRVSYQLYNSCKLTLPYAGSHLVNGKADVMYVVNTSYYTNGMVKMMETSNSTYDFLENAQKMVVASYLYTGDPAAEHSIDSYECVYNSNRDLLERKIRYNGQAEVTVESFPTYQYDDKHNWTVRYEDNSYAAKYYKREYLYFN